MRPQTGSEGGATARGAGGSRLGGLDATHEMTLDEAAQILNVKKQQLIEESEVLKMLKVSTGISERARSLLRVCQCAHTPRTRTEL